MEQSFLDQVNENINQLELDRLIGLQDILPIIKHLPLKTMIESANKNFRDFEIEKFNQVERNNLFQYLYWVMQILSNSDPLFQFDKRFKRNIERESEKEQYAESKRYGTLVLIGIHNAIGYQLDPFKVRLYGKLPTRGINIFIKVDANQWYEDYINYTLYYLKFILYNSDNNKSLASKYITGTIAEYLHHSQPNLFPEFDYDNIDSACPGFTDKLIDSVESDDSNFLSNVYIKEFGKLMKKYM